MTKHFITLDDLDRNHRSPEGLPLLSPEICRQLKYYSPSCIEGKIGLRRSFVVAQLEPKAVKLATGQRPEGNFLLRVYSLDEARSLQKELQTARAAKRTAKKAMQDAGQQKCRYCGKLIPFPGKPYCDAEICQPASWALRLKRKAASK